MIPPTQDEPTIWCSETSAQDVVERIKVVPPSGTGDELFAYFLEEAFQGIEGVPIDWQQRLHHVHDAQRQRSAGGEAVRCTAGLGVNAST